MSKSLEICVSGQHKTRWQFFNDGKLFDDETFHIVEKCQFNDDFPAYLKNVKKNPRRMRNFVPYSFY